MTDDQITAALDQLAAQREQITRLDAREATHYATLTGLLAGLTARTGPDPARGDPDGYQPDPAPPWWKLGPQDRQEPVARLRAWVDQVYRPGYGHLAVALGPCWPAHDLCLYAHARARRGGRAPEPAWPETAGPRITALARHDPETGTVTLVLDFATASIAMFALAAHADEREAHIREVERSGADLPDGSYGRRNRQAIAARETRVAARLRAVQHAYQAVAGHDTAFRSPEPARALRPPGHAAYKEIELE